MASRADRWSTRNLSNLSGWVLGSVDQLSATGSRRCAENRLDPTRGAAAGFHALRQKDRNDGNVARRPQPRLRPHTVLHDSYLYWICVTLSIVFFES
jgi:hypothetical protein